MKLLVNGIERDLETPPLESLLTALREELAITSPKAGCLQGGCGACTVLVDGEPRRSCLVPLAAVDGASVTTVEGLGTNGELAPVQAAFFDNYATQCGFCVSGFMLAAHSLLEREPGAGRDQIIEGLAGHMCRCTGYVKIVEAVEAAARGDVDTRRDREPETLTEGSQA
jgi:aerobic carbon-monoxide dehydrogenase small subunit